MTIALRLLLVVVALGVIGMVAIRLLITRTLAVTWIGLAVLLAACAHAPDERRVDEREYKRVEAREELRVRCAGRGWILHCRDQGYGMQRCTAVDYKLARCL